MAVGGASGSGSSNPYARGGAPAQGTAPPKTEGKTAEELYDKGSADPTKRAPSTEKKDTDALYDKGGVGETSRTTGAGAAGGAGATPDVGGSGKGGRSSTENNVKTSIEGLAPSTSSSQNLQDLGDATNQLQRATNESDKETLKADAEKQKQLAEQKKAAADEAAKKAEEAKKQAEGQKWWGVFKSALNWIGSIVSIAAGVALCLTGAGAAVGALMIAGGTAGLLNAIDSTVKLATGGTGIAGTIAKWAGASDEAAANWDLGFSVTMSVIQLGCSIATFFVNPAQLTSATAQAANLTSQITGIATGVVSGVGDAVSAVVGYDITGKKAGAMSKQAQAQSAESAMKSIEAAITAAMKNADSIGSSWSKILDGVQEKTKETGDTNSRTQFKG